MGLNKPSGLSKFETYQILRYYGMQIDITQKVKNERSYKKKSQAFLRVRLLRFTFNKKPDDIDTQAGEY